MRFRITDQAVRQLRYAALAAISVSIGGILTLGIRAVPVAGTVFIAGLVFIPVVRRELRPLPGIMTLVAGCALLAGAFTPGRTLIAVSLTAVALGGGLLHSMTRAVGDPGSYQGGGHGRLGS